MAYINVAEWSPDQVTEWLKGELYKNTLSFALKKIQISLLINIYKFYSVFVEITFRLHICSTFSDEIIKINLLK